MKVKKKSLNQEKIFIDIVLCPKTNLYLQSLYCHRCAYFNTDEEGFINCNYKNPQIKIIDKKKEDLIKIFSNVKKKKDTSSLQLKDKIKNNELKRNLEILKGDLFREIKKRRNFNLI